MEFLGKKWRVFCGTMGFWAMGILALTGIVSITERYQPWFNPSCVDLLLDMMTSWHGNAFRIIGFVRGTHWSPVAYSYTNGSNAELWTCWSFLCSNSWRFDVSYYYSYDVIVMKYNCIFAPYITPPYGNGTDSSFVIGTLLLISTNFNPNMDK